MSEIIEEEIIPTFKMFPRNGIDNIFKIYSAVPKDMENTNLVLNEKCNIIIKGRMQNLELERVYKARLEGVDDPKYGFGYNVHSIFEDIPTTFDAQHNFLKSMMTDIQLAEIYKVYPGTDIIELFKSNTFDYNKVKGLGLITYERIKKRIIDNLEWQSLFSELGKYGIKFETMKKLVDIYGTAQAAIETVKTNPYVLTELNGIGFKKADVIAKNMGIPETSPFRIHSGIKHAVKEEENSGHTFIERKNLITKTIELLVIDEKYIVDQINEVEGLYIEDNKIALYKTYKAESEVAKILVNRLKKSNKLNVDVDKFLNEQEKEYGFELTGQQRGFFHDFVNHNVVFLVGNAGTGKSFLQKLLINLIKKMNIGDVEFIQVSEDKSVNRGEGNKKKMSYKLLAPTGRAAKLLSQYVEDTEAFTIHKAVGYGKRDNGEDDEGQIEILEDVVLGDEMSMTDIKLANILLKKATNPNLRLVFIGDDFQIASVGCGNFLKDCLDSGIFPVTKLDKVFRQEEGGGLDIATKVRMGIKFIDDDFVGEKKFGKDAIIRSVDQAHMEKGYQHYYKMFLKMCDPEDIMVLSPTKKGTLGTIAINKYIQSIVNPPMDGLKEIKYHDECTFRVNDYVMNTRNTYEIRDINGEVVDIVNGDSGKIVDIVRESDLKDEEFDNVGYTGYVDSFDELDVDEEVNSKEYRVGIYVQFDIGVVAIPFEKMEQLMHSWSLTKHKSQGGSARAVISVADKSQKFQLNANLIYTGLTRFKEFLVLLCQADTLNFALRKFENKSRRTFLEGMLREEYQKE